VETGSLYHVFGISLCSTNGPLCGVERNVVYFSIDYQGFRHREVNEFLDGRFVPVSAKVK
jgi:hypothetical protein